MNRSCFGSNLCFHCLKLVELQKYNFYETFPFFVLSLYPVFLSLIFMYMLSTNIMMLLSLTLFLLASKTFKRFRQNVNEPSCSVNQTRGYAHIETVCNVQILSLKIFEYYIRRNTKEKKYIELFYPQTSNLLNMVFSLLNRRH